MKTSQKGQSRDPHEGNAYRARFMDRTALRTSHLEIDSRVRAVTSAEEVDPRVLEVLDLPTFNLAAVQDEDQDLQFIKELLRDHDVRPPWDIVREESAEVKILWTQFHWLKIQENILYRWRKETTANPQWQVVAPKPLRSQIFKACHHHAMAAHQGLVRTAALIKRRF